MIFSLLFDFSPYFLPRLAIVSSNLHCFGSKLSNRQQHLQLTEGVQSHKTQPGSLDPYIDLDMKNIFISYSRQDTDIVEPIKKEIDFLPSRSAGWMLIESVMKLKILRMI